MTARDHGAARAPFAISRRRLIGASALVATGSVLGPTSRVIGGADATPVVGTPEQIGTPTVDPQSAGRWGALRVIDDPEPEYDADPVIGGELRLVRPGSAAQSLAFNPAAMVQDFQVSASYLDPLLRADSLTMEPRPWLAERWEWSDTGTEVTYRLRSDVQWHDGTPLTAEDVVFSFVVHRDDVDSRVWRFFSLMLDIQALDEGIVRVTLSEPDGNWLLNASTQPVFQRAQYKTFWDRAPLGERTLTGFDWISRLPIGTGPWIVDEISEKAMAFNRNDAYWTSPPHFERLTVAWGSSSDDRLDAWRTGNTDLLWPVSVADVNQVADIPGALYVADAASVMFAAFNFYNSASSVPDLFWDIRVRRALSMAIDRTRYAASVFDDAIDHRAVGTVAQPWAHDPSLRNPRHDPDAARALLQEVGWDDRDGDRIMENPYGVPLVITAILLKDSRPELLLTLQDVAESLLQIGVILVVESLEPEAFRARWTLTRDYDLIAYAYDLYPGFSDFDLYGTRWDSRWNIQGWNPGGYTNPVVDAAIAEALVTFDLDDQRDILVRLQRALDDDLFALWLGFPKDLILVRDDVLGFRPNISWQTLDTRNLWRSA